jgi:hypothetical protein
MNKFAKLSGKETLHYAKHLVQGWWQDVSIKDFKRLILCYTWLKGVILDYKNKLLPNSKFKAMNVFFSKSGFSLLGAMIFWEGEKEVKDEKVKGLSVWFVDMIMANTTSQEMQDMMLGLEMVLNELQKPYLVDKVGKTKEIFVLSDNALVSAPLSPSIHAFNEYARSPPTTSNLEAAPNSETEPGSTNNSSSNDTSSESFGTTPSNNDLMGAPSNNDDSDSAELDAETQLQLDQYMVKLNRLNASKIGNWSSSVRPLISKWLTWEAQKGKSQLDTHFAYPNKQLSKPCLEGEINYIDLHKTFEALNYKGGARATATILVEQLEGAQTMLDLSKAVFTDREGIDSVHDLTFEANQITHTFFSNIDTGKKVHRPEDSWPSLEGLVGKAIKRHGNDGELLFFPFKEM